MNYLLLISHSSNGDGHQGRDKDWVFMTKGSQEPWAVRLWRTGWVRTGAQGRKLKEGSCSRTLQGPDRLWEWGVWRWPGPCLHLSVNGGLCAYFIVFKKLTLPCNHLKVSWCLRQPDSLPNESLEKVTKSWQNVRAGRNLRIILSHCLPTSRWGSFLANQILPRSQVCKYSSLVEAWLGG